MGKKQYVPRWLHSRVVVTSLGDVIADPELFMNKTSWPFKIEHLTIFGYPLDPQNNFLQAGGIGALIQGEIGISGSTDVNLVPAPVSASFGCTELHSQIGAFMEGTTMKLKHPYLLPRDSGFSVECTLNLDDCGERTFGTAMNHGVALFGVKVQSGKPAMLAGLFRHLDVPTGSSFTVEAADLFNDGEEDVLVQSMQLTHPMEDMNSILMGVYWKINPMSGLTWMDSPVHISGITPYTMSRRTFNGIKPFSLTPLEDTYLYRRQRLGIKLTPLVVEDQPVNITLFGYLEVE